MGTPAPRSAPASSVATLGLAGLAAPGCFHHFHSLFFLAPFSRVRVVRVSCVARVAGVASCFCPAKETESEVYRRECIDVAEAVRYSRRLAGPDVNERNGLICGLSTSTYSASLAGSCLRGKEKTDIPTACAALFASHYCLNICYAESLT
uniref:Putative secreted protein n=1 Tax=Ixodes ricinus TaxID=34613 RepID=A0A6B0UV08_IXORI